MRILWTTLILAAPLTAQNASLTGRITDSSGAVIPGASIAIRSLETGIRTATETNAERAG